MMIEGIEIPFGSKFLLLVARDPDEPDYGKPFAEATFDGRGWVAADPDNMIWDASNEDTREDVPMSDPMFAYWQARIVWRSSTCSTDMLGPDGQRIMIGGWDAPR